MSGNRFTVVEYEPYSNFVAEASVVAGVNPDVVRRAIATHGNRIGRVLGVSPPIRLVDDSLFAEDVAGIVRVLPNLELEIAPKFLGSEWANWREDFLLVANIARSGQLLARERLASSPGDRDDLASLVAHTFLGLFEGSRRRPLRTYHAEVTQEWSLDGDFDPEDFFYPESDGFRLQQMALSNKNSYNAAIRLAAQSLATEVHDGVLQQQLRRVASRLGRQRSGIGRIRDRVPSRHSQWQPMYDLARQVNRGLGIRLEPGGYSSPGYVLTTWLAFEQLILTALRVGIGKGAVTYHPSVRLGTHLGGRAVTVEPDFLVRRDRGEPVLADAKYKGRLERAPSIGAADLYEALAFLEATGRKSITLIYPRTFDGSAPLPVGTLSQFDEVTIHGRTVVGSTLECRGLSLAGGFARFSKGLAALLD